MIWLCVHLPQLPLELFARSIARPLDEVPIVLVDTHRVTYCNVAARNTGIAPGCTLATAQSLCHSLVHGTGNRDAETRRLHQLAELVYRFSATVTVQEPDAILIELRASLKLFGGLYRLKRRIKRLFTELGHMTELGIAHTPAAAVVLARARIGGCSDANPSPDALVRHSLDALRSVDIRDSDCQTTDIERLANMGLARLGQLFKLQPAYLAKRFGPALPDYLARLTGARADPRVNIVPAPTFGTSVHLLESVTDKATLLFPMQRLLAELSGWLVARSLGISRLRWRFAALSGQTATIDIELTEPQQSKKGLLAVSRLELDRRTLPGEVLSISLEALLLEPWQERHRSLLAAAAPDASPNALSAGELIDRLKARLGATACRSLDALDDHRPERACHEKPPALSRIHRERPENGVRRDVRRPQRRAGGRSPERPLWLLPEPRPVARHQLRLIRGPERIETGWWDDEAPGAIDRHYYIAHLSNGARCWVFTDSDHTAWYLHGYFG